MYKATPNFTSNFSFIQVSSLPIAQQHAFLNWIPQSSLHQLTINNITLSDCVDYQEYNYWYDFQFMNNRNKLDISF